jgi:hypothetical protein
MSDPSPASLPESRIGFLCRLMLWTCTFACFQGALAAQEASWNQGAKQPSFSNFFRSREPDPTRESPKATGRSQPAELRVIDRQTARQMQGRSPAGSAHPAPQAASRRDSISAQGAMNEGANGNTNLISQDANHPSIRQASHQIDQATESRWYQTPAPQPSPYDPYYGHPYGYPPSNMQSNGPPLQFVNPRPQSMEAPAIDPRMELLDDRRGFPAEEHPGFNPKYSYHPPQGTSQRPLQHSSGEPGPPISTGNSVSGNQTNMLPAVDGRPTSYDYESDGSALDQKWSDSRIGGGYGQGYLQDGANLHGFRLQNRPRTATESALNLQAQYQQSQNTIGRLQSELEVRNRDLDISQATIKRKEEELGAALIRIDELRAQVQQLTAERNEAVQQRITIEHRFNNQLKGIETMLDGVLLEQLTNNPLSDK